MLPPPWKVYHFLVVCGDQRTCAHTGGFHLVGLACFELKSLVAGRLMVIEDCFSLIELLVLIEFLFSTKGP